MSRRRDSSIFRVAATALALLASSPFADAADRAIDAKGLTKEQFKALPDSAVLEIRGKRYTAAELRARGAKNAAARARLLPALRVKAKSEVGPARSAFLSGEKTRIERANAALRLQYSANHKNLSAGVFNPAMTQLPPEISGIGGTAEPGASLYVHGKHFGTGAGKVVLKGLPGGDRTLPFDSTYLFPWSSDGIAVTVPEITGVLDQTVSIQVVTKNGVASNAKSLPFKATVDVTSAFPNKVIKCGSDATENACLAYDFFEGTHIENTFWEDDAVDCDEFRATAKLPWVYEKFQISNDSSGGQIGNPGAVRDGDFLKWQVCWTVNGAGPYSGNHASYVGFVMIKGPKGVPSF